MTLGWIQRGGPPSGFDRILGTKFGHAAGLAIEQNRSNVMVALKDNEIVEVNIHDVLTTQKEKPKEFAHLLKINE